MKLLRSLGFKTFSPFIDESYDDEIHDHQRIEKIAFTLKAIDILPAFERALTRKDGMSTLLVEYGDSYNEK